jgi:Putative zinc-finger
MDGTAPMHHDEALDHMAVELYILDELSPEERDRFEEHYFTCPDCAEAVRSAAAFRDGVVAISAQAAAGRTYRARVGFEWRTAFRLPFLAPLTAAAALAVMVVYQQTVVIPGLHHEIAALTAPEAATLVVAHPVERGADDETGRAVGTPAMTLYFDAPVDARPYPRYRCEIRDLHGSQIASLTLNPPGSGHPFAISLPRASLPAGEYSVAVYGLKSGAAAGIFVARYFFRIQ